MDGADRRACRPKSGLCLHVRALEHDRADNRSIGRRREEENKQQQVAAAVNRRAGRRCPTQSIGLSLSLLACLRWRRPIVIEIVRGADRQAARRAINQSGRVRKPLSASGESGSASQTADRRRKSESFGRRSQRQAAESVRANLDPARVGWLAAANYSTLRECAAGCLIDGFRQAAWRPADSPASVRRQSIKLAALVNVCHSPGARA